MPGTKVCIELCDSAAIDTEHVLALLVELTSRNFALYSQGVVADPPWSLAYDPDARSRTVAMRDACMLASAGKGSCGELAAAYAAWLALEGDPDVQIAVIPQATNEWHAVAIGGDGTTYDPQDA